MAWDGETERVVIEAGAVTGEEDVDLDDDEDGPDLLRVSLTGAVARAFAKRALAVVSAGRPPCPFCELPLEPEGHICPRQTATAGGPDGSTWVRRRHDRAAPDREPTRPSTTAAGSRVSTSRGFARQSDIEALLREGALEVIGRMVDASNATLYCEVTLDGVSATCVHKPVAGERPLWDFPDGTLADREVAAYVVSEASGWDLVPPTVSA